jgi:hypothetical protein
MALQPFVGPWPLFQFCNLFDTDGTTPLTSDQPVERPLPTHTEQHKHRINPQIDIHGIRTHDPSVRASEDSSCLRPRSHCDRCYYLLPVAISLEVDRQEREADHSLRSSTEVKNSWNCTTSLPHVFRAWCLRKQLGNTASNKRMILSGCRGIFYTTNAAFF